MDTVITLVAVFPISHCLGAGLINTGSAVGAWGGGWVVGVSVVLIGLGVAFFRSWREDVTISCLGRFSILKILSLEEPDEWRGN